MTRVAVTGIGVVAPQAIGVEAFDAFLERAQTAAADIDRFDAGSFRTRRAALVGQWQPRDFIAPMKLRRMNALSRYAVAAARMAVLDHGRPVPSDAGVAIGTAFGPVQTSVDYLQEYVEKGAALAPPQLFAESVANAPGSHMAIEFGLRGFNVTVTQRESSALAALMYGSSQIAKGEVPAAIIGGVDQVTEIIFEVLDRLGAISDCAKPFDRSRKGMLYGEGSAVMVAEAKPSREPYGWISGFGLARDATAPISDWGEGYQSVAAAMRAAIDDAEIAIDDIDAIYASANGTQRADRVEYRAIQSVFDDIPPVVATKGSFGEYAGGGSLQIAAALLALRNQRLHASVGFSAPDEEMRFTPTRQPRAHEMRHVLVNSISAGGGIVSAVFSREGV